MNNEIQWRKVGENMAASINPLTTLAMMPFRIECRSTFVSALHVGQTLLIAAQ